MKIAIASDHGGYPLKAVLIPYLRELGHEVEDFGCHSTDSCDYPDYAEPAARAVARGDCARGIVICSTGIGVSMAANKVRGVRCALCGDVYSAEMTRRHNDANVLALGASLTAPVLAERIVDVFLSVAFECGRHSRRIGKVDAIEP